MRAAVVSQRLWALLALLLCLDAVLAGVVRPLPRREDSTTTEAASTDSTSVASTAVGNDASASTSVSITTSTGTDTATASTNTGSSSTGSATSTIISATPFVALNGTQYNSTAPGQLPLTPARTPGFYVAAFVLMISGAAYIVFGMKKPWLHCFFSFAFLVAIAITALELLLVPTPVGNGQQGGYIVGVIAGGAVAGGLATLRPKFFHFFGSILGGFCFAMWLLTLKASALLGRDTLKNSVFLAAFSLVSLGFYCNTRTKHYLVMFSSSFSGATAVILGVDCISCAGLKEFWAWIWNLPNDGLFPIDADTYPMKTGMQAELGVTIVLFLLGVVFQWTQLKTMKEQRIKEERERNEGQAAVQQKDEKAGLAFEQRIAAERSEFEAKYNGTQRAVYTGNGSRTDKFLSPMKKLWKSIEDKRTNVVEGPRLEQGSTREANEHAENGFESRVSRHVSARERVHGDAKDQTRTSVHTADDYATGDADTDRKHRISGSATTVTGASTAPGEQEIELDDFRSVASPQPKTAAELVMSKEDDGSRVRVHVAVDEVEVAAAAWAARNPVPEVTPLPFKVPTDEGEEEQPHAADDEDCSSVAVMTEGFHNDEVLETRSIGSKRSSFAKRLSTGSADLFRRLSHHSLSNRLDKAAMGAGESTEDLAAVHHGDRTSIAATCDDVSSVDEDGLPASGSVNEDKPFFSKEVKAELADKPSGDTTENPEKAEEKAATEKTPGHRPASMAAESSHLLETAADEASAQDDQGNRESSKEAKGKQIAEAVTDDEESSKPAKTDFSEAASRPLNLATGKLDKKVSQVVKQYRMVEWAKHQTLAEEPILDNLDLSELGGPSEPVPVNVEELLKTAEDGAPRVAKPRTEAILQARARQSSYQSQSRLSPNPENDRTGSMNSNERQAAIRATAAALAGGVVHRASPTPYELHAAVPAAEALRSRPPVPGVASFNSPQSLVAKRETMLRIKQQALRPDSLQQQQQQQDPDDDDDMPLSQRQAIIRERRSSMTSANSSSNHAGSDGSSRRSHSGFPPNGYGSGASSLAMNQHPPQVQHHRSSFNLNQQHRESQLAGFRSAVQADLRASNASLPVTNMAQRPGFGGGYMSNSMTSINGPLINSVYTIPGTSSANSLLPQQTQAWNAEVSRNLDMQRQSMMAQKEVDARRRESRRAERERQSQMRQSSMGSHRLLDAHSAALMNLQKKARDAM